MSLGETLLSAMLTSAIRTLPLDDEGNGVGVISFGQFEARDMDVFHAEGAMARLAIEVDVPIVVIAFAVLLTELIVEHASSVFEGMHHLMLQEEREHTEYARLVHRPHQSLQIAEALRVPGFCQGLHHQYSIGGRANALAFHFAYDVFWFHLPNILI